ncbi:MAG: isoaspartyl peptidase/L-asparaginase [Eubacteriales bacterium]|nr:isoaspartyl peptidase/L-asparaginase [Eubacteriales bacterium]
MKPILIATWPFAARVVAIGGKMLETGANAMDAAVATIAAIEDDPSIDSVGFGALPNIRGEMQFDAACMDGATLKLGAVLGLEGFKNPIRVAQDLVWEYRNNVLCGQGAADYALAHDHQQAIMITDDARRRWEAAMAEGRKLPVGHDTIGCLAFDSQSKLAACVSTSGLGFKHRGRVGDSPLVGSGFYADDEAGAAAATGVGEDIMKGCVSYGVVECMRSGMHPQEAVEKMIKMHVQRMRRGGDVCGNFAMVALDNKGNYGGAGTENDFSFSIFADGHTVTVKPEIVQR